MTPVRWTVLATQVPPGGSLGGVVRYTTELTRALAARPDVELSVIGTRSAVDTLREITSDRARVLAVPDLPTPALSVLERSGRHPAFGHETDVVHGMKHIVPRRTAAARVLTVHDMLLLDRRDDFGLGKRVLLPRPYRRSILDADLVLCVSRATRDRLVAHVPAAVDRAAIVHLATSPTLRAAAPAPITALAGRRFALVVGDPTPRKNLATIMAAWPAVRRAHPDVVLAIAGPPSWGRTSLGETHAALVADGAVVPLGHVSDAELKWAYQHTDVVLGPSLAEGFGLPVAEALDLGAPIVISTDPALREVAAGRERACVPPTDVAGWVAAIGAALTDPVPPAIAPVREWDEVAEETVSAVTRMLGRRRVLLG